MRSRGRCGAAVVALLLANEKPASSAQEPRDGAVPSRRPAAAAMPDLDAVPLPLLDVFEPAARRHLEQARATAASLVAERHEHALEAFGALCALYLRYELFDAAEPCLAQARALAVDDFRWPYYEAVLHARDADLERGRDSIEAALRLRPDDVPALLRAGDLHLLAGERDRAEAAYAAALAADPASGGARFGLGRAAAARGDTAAAIQHFEAALEDQPVGSVVHHHLGMAYRAAGDLERAREELAKNRQIEIVYPDPLIRALDSLAVSRESIFNQGIELLRRGDPEAASAAFQRVLELAPEDAQAHYNLARALIDLDRLDQAEGHLRRALAAWPDFFDAHLNLAILLGRTGRADEAAAHLDRAVALDPEHGPTRILWARVLAGRGDEAAATRELEAVLRLDPSNVEARLALAALRVDAGDLTAARRHFEQVLASGAASGRELAEARLRLARLPGTPPQTAAAHLRAAVEHDPRSPAARRALAERLALDGAYAAAAVELTALVEIVPDDPRAHLGLATVLLRAGSFASAREALEQGTREIPDDLALQNLLARLLATCPDGDQRDGARAVVLAQALVERRLTYDHAETLAMALAEAGRFDDAVEWQRRVLARRNVDGAPSPASERWLEHYLARRPVREPWQEPAGEYGGPLAGAHAAGGIAAPAAAESHRRMLDELRKIAEATAEQNPWLGEGRRLTAAARLAAAEGGDDEVERFRALLELAEQDLRLGDEELAIERFAAAYEMLPRLAGRIDEREASRAVFRLGVAHLRWGETHNCSAQHSAESCILPIRGAGIHTEPQGSLQAIRYLEEVLARVPQSSPLFLKAVWLANLAHMTLGNYPDGVPDRYRVPPSVFASSQPFPAFRNVAPEKGVATWSLSGGAALDDFDGDGDPDLLTTTFDTRGEPRYFRNDGGAFVDRTVESGLGGLYGGLNLVTADLDNDGDLDVYVTRGAWLYAAGRHPNSLLRNDGAGRFTDVTFAAGLGERRLPTQTAAWADYDGDGDLDLFVGNEHGPNPDQLGDPTAHFDAPSELYRNQGDGTFVEVAAASGIALRDYVKAVVFGDHDNDGDPDLYVSILGGRNRLYRNDGDGSFADVTDEAGVGAPVSSFPAWFWDFDNDGNLDLYVATYAGAEDTVALVAATYFGLDVPYELPRLYRGDGDGRFEDVAEAMGLDRFHAAMGSNFGDLDGDGWLDFYLGTGYPNYEGLMPNVLYRGNGGRSNGRRGNGHRGFADVTAAAGVGHLQKGHAVSIADIDGDGDQDLFAQMGGAYPGDRFADALFLNPGGGNRWIAVDVVGSRSNRSAIGARIRVDVVEDGRRRSIHRQVSTGGSFGANPLRQTIGVGRAEAIERLEVWWPTTGVRQAWTRLPVDSVVRVVEPPD